MADNTRMKEVYSELRKNSDEINRISEAFQSQLDRLEASNLAQQEQISRMQLTSESQFTQLNTAMTQVLHRMQNVTNSNHGASNSAKEGIRTAFHVRPVKLDFPRFSGSNVLDWIFKAEQFFDYHGTPDVERLLIASVHLDQEVVPWFQLIQRTDPFDSWTAFTRALELDFGPSTYECPRATLFKLLQTGPCFLNLHKYFPQGRC